MFYPQQERALDEMEKWLRFSRDNTFTLEGYAGTGKSFIIAYFLNNVAGNGSNCITAPTHKALRNAEEMLGRRGKTLQSLHGLRPNTQMESFTIENLVFSTDPRSTVHMKDYGLIVIDEASMITKGLYELNEQRAKQYNCKILYVGDSLQLPPVDPRSNDIELSPVFSNKNKFTLTEIVRQEAGHPLMELFGKIRSDVINKGREFLEHIKVNREEVNNIGGYKLYNTKGFTDAIITMFNNDKFFNNLGFIRGCSYTNMNVKGWNQVIRDSIFENPEDIVIRGDLLTAYTSLYDENQAPLILNSDDYIVTFCSPYINDLKFRTYAVELTNIRNERDAHTFQIVDHKHESFKTFIDIANYRYVDCMEAKTGEERKKAWFKWFKFTEKYLLLTDGVTLYNGHSMKKSLDYGYFLTAHKL